MGVKRSGERRELVFIGGRTAQICARGALGSPAPSDGLLLALFLGEEEDAKNDLICLI